MPKIWVSKSALGTPNDQLCDVVALLSDQQIHIKSCGGGKHFIITPKEIVGVCFEHKKRSLSLLFKNHRLQEHRPSWLNRNS
jgi:hypothetical protein